MKIQSQDESSSVARELDDRHLFQQIFVSVHSKSDRASKLAKIGLYVQK